MKIKFLYKAFDGVHKLNAHISLQELRYNAFNENSKNKKKYGSQILEGIS